MVPCRSWLASEEASTFNIDFDGSDAFAGKSDRRTAAPTGFIGPTLAQVDVNVKGD